MPQCDPDISESRRAFIGGVYSILRRFHVLQAATIERNSRKSLWFGVIASKPSGDSFQHKFFFPMTVALKDINILNTTVGFTVDILHQLLGSPKDGKAFHLTAFTFCVCETAVSSRVGLQW